MSEELTQLEFDFMRVDGEVFEEFECPVCGQEVAEEGDMCEDCYRRSDEAYDLFQEQQAFGFR